MRKMVSKANVKMMNCEKEAEGAVGAIEPPDIGSATNEELEEFVTKVLKVRCIAEIGKN